MGHLFRNKEIRIIAVLMLIATVVFTAAGFLISPRAGWLAGAVCIFFVLIFWIYTGRRYKEINKIAAQIDLILHNETTIPFDEYKEGELSILQAEISKMTIRLSEQADNLKKDKIYLSDAMADISHQLRSPLTSSQLILDFLRNPELEPEKRSQLLRELSQLLSHINQLIEILLKMAKMDAKTAYLKPERVGLRELILDASEPVMVPMELHGQNLKIDIDNDIWVNIDYAWTREAFANILKNCMEHITEGGNIWVEAKDNAIFTQIVIRDDGCGIDDEDLPHIFERFYKGKDSKSTSVGIGLALARMIITNQNGTISAGNIKGKDGKAGAEFKVRFYKETTV